MDVDGKSKSRVGVAAGSVWECRMKLDEFRGGIKVFKGEENSERNSDEYDDSQVHKNSTQKQNLVGGVSGRRKTWKSEMIAGFDKNPILIARQRSESPTSSDCDEPSESDDGIKKSLVLSKKTQPAGLRKNGNASVAGNEKSPVKPMKTRSILLKGNTDGIPLRKHKPEFNKALDERSDGTERNSESDEAVDRNVVNSVNLRKFKSVSTKRLGESGKSLVLGIESKKNPVEKSKLEANKLVGAETENGLAGFSERRHVEIKKNGPNDDGKQFGLCAEKIMTSNSTNMGQVKSLREMVITNNYVNHNGVVEDWDEELWEDVSEEIEDEKSCDVKEITISEHTPKKAVVEEKKIHPNENPVPISQIGKTSPLSMAKFQPNNGKTARPLPVSIAKSQQNNEKSVPLSSIVRKQISAAVNSSRYKDNCPDPTKTSSVSDGFQQIPRAHSKLQTLVDLVMWRDVSRTTFVFGIGTFLIISSSYTKDLNFSFISVVSYLSLVHLAAIFIFRTIIRREPMYIDDTSHGYILEEDEAIWQLKLVLPYLNEFLLKLKALFSGDPATTMKLAVLLFVLARCSSLITIWNLAKLGFFGVFIIPKVCSSYSIQLTEYGKIRDAWNSCPHKKAVTFGIFILVWNLSSMVDRFCAAFLLLVAYKYYQQQSLMTREVSVPEAAATATIAVEGRETCQGEQTGGMHNKPGRRFNSVVDMEKQKKRY